MQAASFLSLLLFTCSLALFHSLPKSPSLPQGISRTRTSSYATGFWDRGAGGGSLYSQPILRRFRGFHHLGRRSSSGYLRHGQHDPLLHRASSRLPRRPAWTVSQDHLCRSPLCRFSDDGISSPSWHIGGVQRLPPTWRGPKFVAAIVGPSLPRKHLDSIN
jgi:hypothetical protein